MLSVGMGLHSASNSEKLLTAKLPNASEAPEGFNATGSVNS